MKLKKFRAANMAEAMQIIKEEIGPDAVIMSSRQVRKKKGPFALFGKKEFEVVAGYEENEVPRPFKSTVTGNGSAVAERPAPKNEPIVFAPVPTPSYPELTDSVNELKKMIGQLSERMAPQGAAQQNRLSKKAEALYQLMLKNGVESTLAREICEQAETIARNRDANEEEVALSLIQDILGKPNPIEPTKYRQRVVMLVGPPGVGKTTTLIKLAYMLVYQERLTVGIVNADSFRVAAKEHIEAYCKILQTDMITIYKPEELKDAMEAFADKDMVLIDTAGKVSDNQSYLMDIAKLINIGKVDDIYITLSAATSERVLSSTINNYSFLKKYSIIVTKTDEAPQMGVFVYLAKISGKPLSYMATGQNVPDDIKLVNPSEIASSIMVK